MRRAVCLLALLFLLVGCTPTGEVEPGDGPAATAGPGEFPTEVPSDEVPGGEPTEEPTGEPEVAAFGEKYVYADGLEVEIIRIRHGRLTDEDWKRDYKDEPSPDWVRTTIRVRNGSGSRLELSETSQITYGPDGVEASKYLDGGSLDGPLLPSKAKSMRLQVYIPGKYQDDVVWAHTVDYEREPAIFVGSIKGDLN